MIMVYMEVSMHLSHTSSVDKDEDAEVSVFDQHETHCKYPNGHDTH